MEQSIKHISNKDCVKLDSKTGKNLLWLVWLSGLGSVPQTKYLLIQFQVGAHAWVAG